MPRTALRVLAAASLLLLLAAAAAATGFAYRHVITASTHPEDALAYGVGDYAYGVMNGDLLNRLFDHYRALAAAEGSEFRLITVPADYFGVSTTPYLEGLRATLTADPAMIVMWT